MRLFIVFTILLIFIVGCDPDRNVDESQMLAVLTDVEHDKNDSVDRHTLTILNITVADIVADTDAGGTKYQGRFVNITAVVKANHLPDIHSLTLVTGSDDATFSVFSTDEPVLLENYLEGESYNFTLFIREQQLTSFNNVYVWSNYAKKDIYNVDLTELVSHAKSDNKRYQGNTVIADLTIRLITEHRIYFITNDSDVYFWVDNISTIPDIKEYEEGKTYTFTLFISYIGDDKSFGNPLVTAQFIRTE